MDTHWFCESSNLMRSNNCSRIKCWWQCWSMGFNIWHQESTTWIWEDKRSYASSNILSFWNWNLHYCFTISYVRLFCTTKSFLPNVKCKMVWEGSGYMKLFLTKIFLYFIFFAKFRKKQLLVALRLCSHFTIIKYWFLKVISWKCVGYKRI